MAVTTSSGASFSLRPLFKLYIQTTTTAVTGGTQVDVYAYAQRTGTENRTPNSSIAKKSFSMPNARQTSTSGALNETVSNQNWTYNWANGDPQVVWNYTRFYAYSAGTSASMTLTAADGAGGLIGTATESHTFTLFAEPTPAPTAPTSLSASSNNSAGVNLSWSGASGSISSYGIWWNTTSSGAPSPGSSPDFTTNSTETTNRAYTDTGIAQGSTRYYWVRAQGTGGNSAWYPTGSGISGYRSYPYVPTPAPGDPTSLTVTDQTNSRVVLNWTGSTGTVNGYYVYRNGTNVGSVTAATRSYSFTGLAANTSYTLGVAAYGPDYSSGTVTITGTTLPNTFTVPNVVGQTQATATSSLTSAGFGSVTPTLVTSGATLSNNLLVISQSPASGTTATSGDAATISVYNYLLPVPNILGLTETAANTALTNAGFNLRSNSLTTSGATVSNNLTVGTQNPTGGTQYNPAYNVAYTIFNFLTAVPNVVGQALDTAITSLGNLGFITVTTSLSEVGATINNVGTVKSQTPVNSGTTYNPKNQSVALVIYSLGVTGKRYTGTGFQALTTAKRYNGTAWQQLTVAKRFDGTQWKDITN